MYEIYINLHEIFMLKYELLKVKLTETFTFSCTYDDVKTTANFLLGRTKYRPKIGIICGSGLGKIFYKF